MAREYKFIRLEGTREALVVVFLNPNIFAVDVIQGIGRELLFAADTAARIDMPLWLSFRGVEDMSSAMIGRLLRALRHFFSKTIHLFIFLVPVGDAFLNLEIGAGVIARCYCALIQTN